MVDSVVVEDVSEVFQLFLSMLIDEEDRRRRRGELTVLIAFRRFVCLCPGEAVTTSRSTLRPSAPPQTKSV